MVIVGRRFFSPPREEGRRPDARSVATDTGRKRHGQVEVDPQQTLLALRRVRAAPSALDLRIAVGRRRRRRRRRQQFETAVLLVVLSTIRVVIVTVSQNRKQRKFH